MTQRADASLSRPSPDGRIDLASALGGYVFAWLVGAVLSSVLIVGLGAAFVDDFDSDDATPIPLLFVGNLAMWASYLALMWWLSSNRGSGDVVADYRVRFRVVDLVGVPIGVATQLVALPLLYWPLRELWPDTFDDSALRENAEDLVDRASGVGVALLVVMVLVGAPIVEELVYRGLLLGGLSTRLQAGLAVIASAAIFALIHFRPVEYPGLFVAGLVFGACAMCSGRLGMAMAAHFGFNAIGLLGAL